MRVRKKKHGSERLIKCAELLTEHAACAFDNEQPLRLEIGCGKGRFVIETAKRHPEINFIAIEKISDVILTALERTKAEGLNNVKFIICDAREILSYFHNSSIEVIYLNFNDPWPQKGYHKRRLTHKNFLDLYKNILQENGRIILKTDNREYFDFSIDQFRTDGFSVINISYDLHHSIWDDDNIQTEYEINFAEKGILIKRCVAVLNS